MAFNLNEYPFMFKSPAVQQDFAERSNSTANHSIVSASSTASVKRMVISYLKEYDRVHPQQRGSALEKRMPNDVSSSNFREKHPWFNTFLLQKNSVVCGGRMRFLSSLMTNFPDLMEEELLDVDEHKSQPVAETLRAILNYIQMQKYIIVTNVDQKTDLVFYSACMSEILASYLFLNISISRPLNSSDPKKQKLYSERAMSWMTHIAFLCDFSLDRICDTILKTKAITSSPPEIGGELMIGLIEQCVKRPQSQEGGSRKKEMATLTFVRVILVFQRFIRWYRSAFKNDPRRLVHSKLSMADVIEKRVEFATKHIVPPSNLKEILKLLSNVFDGILNTLPMCPQDKVVMTHLLTGNFKTSEVNERLEDLLCDENRLPLLALHTRDVTPQFPHVSQQVALEHPYASCRSSALKAFSGSEAKPKLSDTEETRLASYSLRDIHERARGAYFPHARLCLTPTRGEMRPPPPLGACGYLTPPGGYNPQSVQSVDSDSQKISSTTATDTLETPSTLHLTYPPGDKSPADEFQSLSNVKLSMLKMPLPMTMAYITTTRMDGSKQALTPCFIIDPEHRRAGSARSAKAQAMSTLRHGANQEMSEDTSADEDSGRGSAGLAEHPSLSSKSVTSLSGGNHKPKHGIDTRLAKRTTAGPKRKGTERAGAESVPDKRPRRCSASTGGAIDPLVGNCSPSHTPLKSVIVHTDPSKAGPSGGEVDPPPSLEHGETGAAFNTAEYFMDDEPYPIDMMGEGGELMQTHPLSEVEGNHSNFKKTQGQSSHHHLHSLPGGPTSSSPGTAPESPLFRDSSPHVGGPLLNNTQSEVVDAHPTSKAPAVSVPHQGGSLVAKRIESQQGFYQDVDALDSPPPYLASISTEDYLHTLEDSSFNNQKKKSEESHSCNEMSDDSRSNTRSSKQAEKTGRRAGGKKAPTPNTPTSLSEQLPSPASTSTPNARPSPRTRATHPPAAPAVRKTRLVVPAPAATSSTSVGGSSTRSSRSRENSVEPPPSASMKNPDKTAEWMSGSASHSVIAQLMNQAPPPPGAHDKLADWIKGKAAKSRPTETVESRLSEPPTNTSPPTPPASNSTNSEDLSPRPLSVGPKPKKTRMRRTPTPPPTPVKRRGRPRKMAPSIEPAARAVPVAPSRRAAKRPPVSPRGGYEEQDEEVLEPAEKRISVDSFSEGGNVKKRRRRRSMKKGEDAASAAQRYETRRDKDAFLENLSRKLTNGCSESDDSEGRDKEDALEAQNLPILQRVCETLTENLYKKT